MIVLKFGGTSVANAENILRVKDIVASKEEQQIVVVSALGGVTDLLLNSAKSALHKKDFSEVLKTIEERHISTVRELIPYQDQSSIIAQLQIKFNELANLLNGIELLNELSDRSLALISSFGEVLSSYIVNEAFNAHGIDSTHFDSRKIIQTDSNYLKAKVNMAATKDALNSALVNASPVCVMGGFISSDRKGNITTLGRGGSDYTASIVAATVEAKHLEIWTDVDGILSADPRIVNQAVSLGSVSYEEAMELSHFGAKVIYPPTIIPAKEKKIPIFIKNTFAPEKLGTKIHANGTDEEASIKGITSIKDIVLASVIGSGMVGIPGFSSRMFSALHRKDVNAIMITQASSEHSISVGINASDKAAALEALHEEFKIEIAEKSIDRIRLDDDMSIVSVVGNNMRHQIGLSGKIFSTLGKNGVNIISLAQGSTERNISTVVEQKDLAKAVNVLHETFFESSYSRLNLFIMGVGLVGSELIKQIKQQHDFIREQDHVDIKVISLANSRKMLFNPSGIDLDNWDKELNDSEQVTNHSDFIKRMADLNLRNSIFVDNTASEDVAKLYGQVAASNISIVACNKIAAASSLADYKALTKVIRKNRTNFRFETNVGASLPVISTITDMVTSGDKIQKIEAVLSGSLNFIFNNYDGSNTFASVVKDAQNEGFTEPDPRVDLSGTDVKRKILILTRVSGYELEPEDVETVSFLPEGSMEASSVDDFYELLKEHESHFQSMYKNATDKHAKLKVVATFEDRKAKVALEEVTTESAYYNLGGKDNIVLLYSDRYSEDPLIIRGAGAGAAVTASGVFGDILKTLRS